MREKEQKGTTINFPVTRGKTLAGRTRNYIQPWCTERTVACRMKADLNLPKM
jgi:hypothetical protein